ncbi:MAG TPA: KpsF/GutQ family sugar-phosphate isomerase [Steroidobacteraceae bacterium]|nr:KpsF/GutQ family sugar-phosphate isomerase [Steroidobacteraceae bacterium]
MTSIPAAHSPPAQAAHAAAPARAGAAPPPGEAALLAAARRALDIEAQAVQALAVRLGPAFAAACRLCLDCAGRLIVTGIGKSGHIAGKVASTLASTGSPSFFLHPAEASHGDLGMITREDTVIVLSNSGETPELLLLLPHLARLGTQLITLTGRPDSTLARAATVTLDVSVPAEACPLNLAPTASTTAMLAMGDALAVTLLEARGFTAADFARSHPGGALGRRLLLRVCDIMRTGDALPRTSPDAPLAQGLLEMSRQGLGMTVIVGEGDRVLGVFTDGDLRRTLDRQLDVHAVFMHEVMTAHARTIGPRELAAEGLRLMEQHRITALPVVEDGRLVGAFNVHDLLRAGVV